MLKAWTAKIDPSAIPISILSNPTTMQRSDVANLRDLGSDIFTVALDAATPELFDRTRGKGVASPHSWKKYWEILEDARDIFGPQKFGAHIIVGMGETEHDVLSLVQKLVDMGGHSHMFCFFPEQGSLMDHLPATPRDQWRRVQLGRYLLDYCGARVEHMSFDENGRVVDFGLPRAELDAIIDAGIAFRTSGCPGKFADDISACDRPYGDSPPSNIASYPFQPNKKDVAKIRTQLGMQQGQLIRHGKPFRIIDTGIREGARNIAFDAALIELRNEGRIPDTIRFLQFVPTALVGRHQDLSREIRLDYCAQNGIGLARRITGGGALYMDEGQFGFELVFHKSTLGISSLGDLTTAICEAAAAGLSKLGVAAKFRPRNDIEVDGPQDQRHRRLFRWRYDLLSGHGAGRDGSGEDAGGPQCAAGKAGQARARLGRSPCRHAQGIARHCAVARRCEAGAGGRLCRVPRHRTRMGRDHGYGRSPRCAPL